MISQNQPHSCHHLFEFNPDTHATRMPGRTLLLLVVCLILFLLINCGQDPLVFEEYHLSQIRSWVTEDSPLAGDYHDFIVTDSDILCATDQAGHRIVFMTSDGNLLHEQGRQGAGPIEYRKPTDIDAVNDTLYVYDSLNRRLHVLKENGDLIRIVRLNPPQLMPTGLTVGPGGRIFSPTGGYKPDGLLTVFQSNGQMETHLGELPGPTTMLIDAKIIREYAVRGEVAPFLENWTRAQATTDMGVIAISVAVPRAIKFASDGTVKWDVTIDFPEYRELVARYREINLTRSESAGVVMTLWRDVAPDKQGGCFLLLNDPEQLIVYHLNSKGILAERLICPDFDANCIYWMADTLWAFDYNQQLFAQFELMR